MEPKILLMNFTKSEADAVEKDTKLKVLRGYVGESVGRNEDGRQRVPFYAPEAFYECDMVFIKLPATEKLKEEFEGLAKEISKDDATNFRNYWKKKGRLLVFYIGDTNIATLWAFDVPVLLERSSGNDTTSSAWMDSDHELFEVSELIKAAIKMPTDRYLESGFKDDGNGRDMFYATNTKWTTYVSNVNRDSLALALSKENGDYSHTNPGVYVMGLPKKISTITTKIVKFFGEYLEIFAVGDDWKSSDEFFPENTLGDLKKQRESILKTAKEDYGQKTDEINQLKEKYSYLTDLVTQQGDQLVESVKRGLEEILGMDVVDSDKANEGDPIEDLFVELGENRQLCIEVKGTSRPTPPLEYTQQPFQHLTRRGYGPTVEPVLILNHDMNKYPPQRTDAFTDKDKEPLIANLHFIDTRELLKALNAVIDGTLTKEVAIEMLFSKMGRVQFSPVQTPEEHENKNEGTEEIDQKL